MSIASKIEILDELRKELARNINTMGVSTTETEGFNELVPKVLQIESGGGGATINLAPCRSDRTFVNLQPPIPSITEFFLQSDTLLNPTLTVKNFEVTDNIVEIKYVNELLIKVVCANPLVDGEVLSVKAKSSAFLNRNGESASWEYNVRNKLEDYYFNQYGMTFLSENTKTDSGGWTTNSTIKVPYRASDDQIRNDLKIYSGRWYISSDCYVNCSNCSAKINIDQRDNSSYNVSYCDLTTSDCGDVLKIRWEGMDPYGRDSVNLIWELFLLANGDIIIIHEKIPTSSFNGTFSVYGIGYTKPTENKTFYSFYAKDKNLNSYTIVQEPYDIRLHDESVTFDFEIPEGELSDFIGNRNGLISMLKPAKHDDDNFTFTFNDIDWDWFYNGTKITKILAYGNSYINLNNNSSCDIKVSGRDAAIYEFWMNVLILSEWNLKCMKVVWYGASSWNGSIDHEWEVYLFSNGDAMIHVTKFGANTGTNTFLGVEFNPSEGANISFYRKNNEGTSWQVEYDIYDPNKHLI